MKFYFKQGVLALRELELPMAAILFVGNMNNSYSCVILIFRI